MKKCFYNAVLVLPDRLLSNGWLLVENEKIARYGSGEPVQAEEMIDCLGPYLFPGFLAVHCHDSHTCHFFKKWGNLCDTNENGRKKRTQLAVNQ